MKRTNQQEAKANHYFTFGVGQGNRMFYVKIVGTYGSARERMFELFGKAWSFQYSEKQFNEHNMTNHYTLHPISLTDEAIA